MIGIYKLVWENRPEIYIGQSSNIMVRLSGHAHNIIHNKHNYKVLDMVKAYGMPSLEVIEECSINDLDAREIYYIREYDSINSGLNIAKGGSSAIGIENNASKYSKIQLLRVFSLLYSTNKQMSDISKITRVHISTVTSMSKGDRHSWLSDEYPEQYSIMLKNRETKKSDKKYPPILGPDGNIYYIEGYVKQFCLNHPLIQDSGTHLSAVLRGARKSHKGFILLDKNNVYVKPLYEKLVDPDGSIFNITNITEFCNIHPLLQGNPNARKGISRVLNKERHEYKGFKLQNI